MAIRRPRGGTPFTWRSPIQMSPEVSASRPAMIRKRVVLPQPDGPSSTVNS
jgi:hypothetical protein